MNALVDLISHHITAFEVGGEAVLIAIICTTPAMYPKTLQEWWTWARDAMQTAVPAARHGQSSMSSTVQTPTTTSHVEATSTNPTQPETKA